MTRAERLRVAEVVGYASPPAGRRTLWAIVVPSCVGCGTLHIHRAGGAAGGYRRGSCGARYWVKIAGAQRARWAAS